MTIVDKIKELRAEYPYKTALVDIKLGEKLDFTHLDMKSDKISTYFERKGFKKGDKIVIFVPISLEFYVILLAMFKTGIQGVFIDPYANTEHINKCCEAVSPEGIIADMKVLFMGSFLKQIRKIKNKINYKKMIEEAENLPPISRKEQKKYVREDREINEQTPALISFTSGSTGFPKIIMRTHGFLLGQHDVLDKNLKFEKEKFEKETKVYSSFPIFLLSHMATGATTFIPNIDLKKPMESKPENIIKQIEENNIQNVILPPVIFENIVKYAEGKNIELKNVKKIYTGGAPVFPILMERIKKIFVNAEIRALYGASEAEPISILNFEDITEEDLENMKNGMGLLVGRKVDEIDLKIEEIQLEKGNSTDEEIRGEITVKGKNVLKGYLNECENSKNQWHKTGDMGYVNKKGQLILLGRVKGKIQINERVYYPFTIETAFSFCEAVKKSVLTSKNDKLYLIIEKNPDFKGNIFENEEIMNLKEKFGIFKIVEEKIPVDKRHNSKTDYKKLEKLVAESVAFKE